MLKPILALFLAFFLVGQEASFLKSLADRWNSVSDQLAQIPKKELTEGCHKRIDEIDLEVDELNLFLSAFLRGDSAKRLLRRVHKGGSC